MAAPAGRCSRTGCGGRTGRRPPTSSWWTATTPTCTSPGLLFVPFGLADVRRITRPRGRQLRCRHQLLPGQRSTTSTSRTTGCTSRNGNALDYDVLIVATGAQLLPDETDGLTGPGWQRDVFTFYTPDGRRGPAPGAGQVRLRPAGRLLRRPADQVPGGAAGVLLPRRRLFPPPRHQAPGRDHLRHAAGRRVHQAGGQPGARRPAGRQGHRAGDRVQHRDRAGHRGAGPGRPPGLLRRPRGALRPGRDRPAARRRRLRRPLARPRRRARFHPGRPAHPAGQGQAERVRPRRRHRRARLQGRVGRALRGRGAGRQRAPVPGRGAAGRLLRRAHQLLHRDRRRPGAADRLQLRHRAADRALPRPVRPPAAAAVPPEPPRQAGLPAAVLARPAPRPRHPRHRPGHAGPRQEPSA